MIQAKVEIFPLAQVFRISRGARTQAEVVTVIYEKDGIIEIKLNPKLFVIDFAKVVFPEPGKSSIKILPSEIIAAKVNFIFSLFPTITLDIFLIISLNII